MGKGTDKIYINKEIREKKIDEMKMERGMAKET